MKKFLFLVAFCLFTSYLSAQLQSDFDYLDVFQLEYANDPQISPDGNYVVYRRMGYDIMKDRSVGSLWVISTTDPTIHHKLTARDASESQARWSPDGKKIAFVSSTENGSEIYLYWTDTGAVARLTQLPASPGNLAWSPNGRRIAFTMKVEAKPPVIAKIPAKPKGAKWAAAPRITDRLKHEADGAGYIKPGFTHIFTISSEGGAPRQLTSGDFNHGGSLSWSSNSYKVFFSANRSEDWEYDFRNSEVYAFNTQTWLYETFTDRNGPDAAPMASPDGSYVAYIGFEDKVQTYQTRKLNLMHADGSNKQVLSSNLDRSISRAKWSGDGQGLYVQYNDLGLTKIGYMDLSGNLTELVSNVGGTTIGRPYASGAFSVAKNGKVAYTVSYPDRPADVAIYDPATGTAKDLTNLNGDLMDYRNMGMVQEINYKSSYDGRELQGWIVYPPKYEKRKSYPLIVENHGGPILNYGPHFSAEMQLYAAKGYAVFYPNPRGSTSYGEEFGNLLYNNYPGQDYNDVMDGVDAVMEKMKIDKDRLYVTGGSAGGIMTAWIVGKTNRFRAAVVAKPVMNWISKTLVADNYYGYANSRYPGQPWENFEGYWKFSPISLVGNVETPTMVMVGMNDLRTPPSEAKQLYHALKLRKIETVLVEIPEASHGIANRPSNLIAKVAHTLAWFEKYK
ncbi:S9 family peptidase [Aureitalea marina]|uniref:Peptidase S9 family protein n=1 Tax=Aureitalea marina TaxID=930804 RepID=A0A2S7KN90_9FLAO|nr:S9 family peptidase [Aureitalea marina]PQB04096.1 peptidase S9 family protein [Aureitalea marina]